MRKGFIFDINKCVACHACVVACQIENIDLDVLLTEESWSQQKAWRKVTTHTNFKHPDLPVFNFSMACNHCEEAPCMSNCPALAYSRDKDFNAVIHQAEACIGCQYCTWVCPYDAPKYNPMKGIVEKCTLCINRLSEGKKTACAASCPTGALDFDSIKIEPQLVEGFPEIGIQPAIKIKALRKSKAPKQHPQYTVEEQIGLTETLNLEEKKENVLLAEWPLIAFSLLSPVLVSIFYAAFSKGITVNKELFIGSLLMTGIISMLHLGKKFRAWRSLFNIRRSWLSREILAYSLFVPTSIFWLYYPQQNELGLIATIFGLLILVSIDNIYRQLPSKKDNKYHSADVLFFTVFLYVAILVSNPWMFFAALALKSYLYITRKVMYKKTGANPHLILSTFRMLFGMFLPIIGYFIFGFEAANYAILSFVVLGEMIDRLEFYNELFDEHK